MTREELEEGRQALDAYQKAMEALRSGKSAFDLGGRTDALDEWLYAHATELLSLAEEARWRDVKEEPPPVLEQVYIDAHVDALPIAYMDPVGVWSDANDEVIAVAPERWRSLPKGPER